MLELQLDQAVEKAETLRNRRSREDRVAGRLGRDVLLFLLHLQDCEKQAGMTSPSVFWLCLFVCGWVCRTPGLLTTEVLLAPKGKRIFARDNLGGPPQCLRDSVLARSFSVLSSLEAGDGDQPQGLLMCWKP